MLPNFLTLALLLATFSAWNNTCDEIGPKKSQSCEKCIFEELYCQQIKRAGGSPRLLLLLHQAVEIQLQMKSSLDKPLVPDCHYLSNQI